MNDGVPTARSGIPANGCRRGPCVAAIIVHHGEPAPTLRALESARAWQGVERHLVLVDHGPGTGEVLARAAGEAGALYLHPERNLGFAGGLNRGLDAVRGRLGDHPFFFLLLNNDVVLDPHAALILARRLEEEAALGIVGPAILYRARAGLVWNAGSEIDWPRGRPRSLFHGRPAGELPAGPYEVGFVCGCAAMVRADLLHKIGPLPEEYFLYFEDAEISFRARRAGYRVEVDPRARALHDPGTSSDRFPALAAYLRVRNRILFSKRWSPPGPRPAAARLSFALGRCFHGRANRRGAIDGLLGKAGSVSSFQTFRKSGGGGEGFDGKRPAG
jgi:hypothetical protein